MYGVSDVRCGRVVGARIDRESAYIYIPEYLLPPVRALLCPVLYTLYVYIQGLCADAHRLVKAISRLTCNMC